MNGLFWLFVESMARCPHYHMGSFDSGGTTVDGIVGTNFWWDSGNANGPFFFEPIFVHLMIQNPM